MLTGVSSSLFNSTTNNASVFTSLQSVVRQQQLQNMSSTSNLNQHSSSLTNINNATSQSSTILQFHQQCQQQQQHHYNQQPQTRSLANTLTSAALTMSSPTAVLNNSMQNNQQQKNIRIDVNNFSQNLGKNLPTNFGKSLSPHRVLPSSTNKKLLVNVFPQNDLSATTVNNYSSATEQSNFKVS